MNILLTCAGRRNYLVNYFKEALNGSGKVVATDAQLNAPALVDADIAVKVPSIYDENYIDTIISVCKQNNVGALLSLNDLELPLIAKNKSLFKEHNITPIISDPDVIEICFDKWRTKQFLEGLNLKVPKTYLNLADALSAIEQGEIQFPLVVKPRWGSASIGIEFPETKEELELSYSLLSLRLSRTILGEVSKEDFDKAILIQEKLKGQEYGMDVLNNLNGGFVASFAKKKLAMRDGETDKAQSVAEKELDRIGRVLGEGLKHIGNLDVDVFGTEKGFYVVELNPRFGGGYPFTHESGVNTNKILIEWMKGNTEISELLKFTPGKSFSKCDRLISIPDDQS